MTEEEIREAEKAQEEYRTAWIEAEYIVMGWWDYGRPTKELMKALDIIPKIPVGKMTICNYYQNYLSGRDCNKHYIISERKCKGIVPCQGYVPYKKMTELHQSDYP